MGTLAAGVSSLTGVYVVGSATGAAGVDGLSSAGYIFSTFFFSTTGAGAASGSLATGLSATSLLFSSGLF